MIWGLQGAINFPNHAKSWLGAYFYIHKIFVLQGKQQL